ncbi:precorrin-8X methylmutase, partial [Bifidobacterium sp. M0353]|nr:precorrin-8X methylmutase [Bifidobacterium sp. M0353]
SEQALFMGSMIFCDSEMVAHGITRRRLPANNKIICTLNHPDTVKIAQDIKNTRSAAAIHLWGDTLKQAVVVIGNAPTALFH